MINNDGEHNSVFLDGCNTDWNLNVEFVYWINYWFKEYRKNTDGMIDLEYFRFKYKDKEYTQKEIIDRIIVLTDRIIKKEIWNSIKEIDEVFDLFHLVFWCMWW